MAGVSVGGHALSFGFARYGGPAGLAAVVLSPDPLCSRRSESGLPPAPSTIRRKWSALVPSCWFGFFLSGFVGAVLSSRCGGSVPPGGAALRCSLLESYVVCRHDPPLGPCDDLCYDVGLPLCACDPRRVCGHRPCHILELPPTHNTCPRYVQDGAGPAHSLAEFLGERAGRRAPIVAARRCARLSHRPMRSSSSWWRSRSGGMMKIVGWR